MAAAVVLDPNCYIPGVCDSKLLSARERERLFDLICAKALAWSVASAAVEEIDRVNIHQASLQAMRRALLSLDPLPDMVLVDAFRIPDLLLPQRGVPHGDRRCSTIAAASIVAKVVRDRQMDELHQQDPRYGFDQHKGYATGAHLAAVARFGYRTSIDARSGLHRSLIGSTWSIKLGLSSSTTLWASIETLPFAGPRASSASDLLVRAGRVDKAVMQDSVYLELRADSGDYRDVTERIARLSERQAKG